MTANCKVKVGDGGVSSFGMLTLLFSCPIYYVPFCVQTEACRQNNVWHVERPVTHQGLVAAAEGVDLGRQYEPTLAVVETNEYVDMLEVGSGPVELSKNAGKGPVSVCFLLTTNTVGFMWLWVPQFLKPSKFLQIPVA